MKMKFRTGIGFDAHQLVNDEKLIIGGVEISAPFGSLGHSDGDGLMHAVVDALLGAAALGDIGKFYPSDEKRWENKSSKYFLSDAVDKVRKNGFEISNIDATIIIQKPKVADFIPKMKYNIAESLQIIEPKISLKATTTDFLGYIGDSSGWACQSVVTLFKVDDFH